MKNIKDIIRPALALFAITAVFTLILSATNLLTIDVIADAREQARLASMSYVLPGAAVFSEDAEPPQDAASSILSYAVGFDSGAAPIGVVAQMTVTGWDRMIFLVGIDLDGAVTGLDIIAHAETPGLGSRITNETYRHQFIGATGDIRVLTRGRAGDNEVMAITGATITVQVIADGVNDALEFINNAVLPNIHRYLPQ
ncbi:MAG: FMN-binding protein [Clostridiales bacterium]|jgi:electron transport complex protein RnfG|nr:FMN-binding protein [Clostridiales bacterium]